MNLFEILLIQPLANALIIFYKVLGNNLGLAIIGFSIFLRFALNPLTKPYLESMKKMREVAPQLEKLKKKYKGDKVKLAQAQGELYRQKGINPGAGCLPYLLQIIILIAFFNMFSRTLSPNGNPTERFNLLLYKPLKFSQNETLNTRFLYLDITKPDVIKPEMFSFPVPGPVILLATLIQFLLAKVTMPQTLVQEKIVKKTKDPTDDVQVAMQKSMVYTFPLLTLFFGMSFSSGLALYWLVFSLSQFIQQVRSQGWGDLSPVVDKIRNLV